MGAGEQGQATPAPRTSPDLLSKHGLGEHHARLLSAKLGGSEMETCG